MRSSCQLTCGQEHDDNDLRESTTRYLFSFVKGGRYESKGRCRESS